MSILRDITFIRFTLVRWAKFTLVRSHTKEN